MKFLQLVFLLRLAASAFATGNQCSASGATCFDTGKTCAEQPYQYLTPSEEITLKALIFYNHVHKLQKRRNELSIKSSYSAKFYRRQPPGIQDTFTFNKLDPIDSVEMADLSGMSSRPLRQVADAASEIQAVVGTSQSGNVDQGSSLANIFTPEEIKRINEMANQLLETVRQRQRNQPQGTQSPQESYVQDVNIFNGVCSVLTRCGTGIAHAAGWVGNGLYYAGRRTGSELSANRGFALIALAFVGLFALVVGIAVGFAKHHGGQTTNGTHPANPPPPSTPSQTQNRGLLFTHFRVELRGEAPQDMPQKKDPNIWADGPIPDYVTKSLPGSIQKLMTDDLNSSNQKQSRDTAHRPNRRDDSGDNFCLPTQARDLNDIVYNIWQTVYIPRMETQGITDQQYHIAHTKTGPFDISNGGSLMLRIWTTPDHPDLDRLKAPINGQGPSLSTAPNWNDPSPQVQAQNAHSSSDGMTCYDEWLPSGADPSNPGPTVSWWNVFSDACKAAFGTNRAATPRSFTYAGAGNGDNNDPDHRANGAGWKGEFVADPTCGRKFACSALVGGSGDGKDGLARKHVDKCRPMAQDGRYHGGVAEMELVQSVAQGSCQAGGSPWGCGGNGIARGACGFMRIAPLTYPGGEVGFHG